MKNKIKVIANYLPQYHRIPENDKWWGEGFTDWMAVKDSTPLYEGHVQPKVPLNKNYYCLDKVNDLRWQANLAREFGIYGFGIYHYWFSSEMQLLQKPAELILENKDIDINFMFIWDNLTWKRTWSKLNRGLDWAPNFDTSKSKHNKDLSGILAEINYGDKEDWKKHYDYLSPFFKDKRYIRENNRPIFSIFQPRNEINTLRDMAEYWNELAIKDGFDGILMTSKDGIWPERLEKRMKYAPFAPTGVKVFTEYKIREYIAKYMNRIGIFSYDECWRNIISDAKKAKNDTYLCGFVSYDDSPRRGYRARVVKGSTPDKFEGYFGELLRISKRQSKEYLFLMAWNEWGEGAYLEPDEEYEYQYLEALKRAIMDVNGRL